MQAAGEAARTIETVAWVLFIGGFAIFVGVMLLLARALRRRAGSVRARLWIVGGGLVFPGAVLAALLAATLLRDPDAAAEAAANEPLITVKAKLWWWEVRYRDPRTGAEVLAANEIRIPAGRPVYLALTSADVIHSFWVPQLAGKVDMAVSYTHLTLPTN